MDDSKLAHLLNKYQLDELLHRVLVDILFFLQPWQFSPQEITSLDRVAPGTSISFSHQVWSVHSVDNSILLKAVKPKSK